MISLKISSRMNLSVSEQHRGDGYTVHFKIVALRMFDRFRLFKFS